MRIETTEQGKAVIVKISGRLVSGETGELARILETSMKKTNIIVVDCRELEYMDSTGLGALVKGLKAVMELSGDLRLAGVLPKVKMLLELTRADKVFQLFPSVADALASDVSSNDNLSAGQ